MAQQPLSNGDTFGIQRGKINANDAENAAAATAAAAAAASKPSLGNATPQPLGAAATGTATAAAREDHAHALPSAPEINALAMPTATFNAAAGTVSSGVVPASNTPPSAAPFGFTVVGAAVTGISIDTITALNPGDWVVTDGTHWQRVSYPPQGPGLYKSDGNGGFLLASPGVDYMPGVSAQCGVPIGIPSSGTFGVNGAVTFTTAFVAAYPRGIWLFYPANAISGASAAGFYWTTGITAGGKTGTVWNTTYTPTTLSTPGVFSIPAAPVAFVSSAQAAYVQSTSVLTVFATVIAANYLGKDGSASCTNSLRMSTTAAKTLRTQLGGTVVGLQPSVSATSTWGRSSGGFMNQGATNAQIGTPGISGEFFFGPTTPTVAAIDTTVASLFALTMGISNVADYMVLESVSMTATPAP